MQLVRPITLVLSGFNSTLRGGLITHHEYIQVGKARDVGMNQISLFEAKLANGSLAGAGACCTGGCENPERAGCGVEF